MKDRYVEDDEYLDDDEIVVDVEQGRESVAETGQGGRNSKKEKRSMFDAFKSKKRSILAALNGKEFSRDFTKNYLPWVDGPWLRKHRDSMRMILISVGILTILLFNKQCVYYAYPTHLRFDHIPRDLRDNYLRFAMYYVGSDIEHDEDYGEDAHWKAVFALPKPKLSSKNARISFFDDMDEEKSLWRWFNV